MSKIALFIINKIEIQSVGNSSRIYKNCKFHKTVLLRDTMLNESCQFEYHSTWLSFFLYGDFKWISRQAEKWGYGRSSGWTWRDVQVKNAETVIMITWYQGSHSGKDPISDVNTEMKMKYLEMMLFMLLSDARSKSASSLAPNRARNRSRSTLFCSLSTSYRSTSYWKRRNVEC